MRYKINWMEVVTAKTGTKYLKMHLRELDAEGKEGKEVQNVTTFNLDYTLAQEIEGAIVQNGNFLNWKPLEAPEFIKKQASNSAYKAQQIEKTMDRKEQSIAKSQDNKEWSIKVASSMNKAIDLAIAENAVTPEDILRWRKWIWNNWDVELTDTDAIDGKIN